MIKTFITAFGKLPLQRIPQGDSSMQAWDAADEFLLAYLEKQLNLTPSLTIAIVNDSFGAIACALKGFKRDSISDSYLSHLATQKNFKINQIGENDEHNFQAISSIAKLQNSYQLVLIKIPKSLAL